MFSDATRVEKDGVSWGAAVLVPSFATIAMPPLLESAVPVPARAVVTQIGWGFQGGLVSVSSYLEESVGLDTLDQSVPC